MVPGHAGADATRSSGACSTRGVRRPPGRPRDRDEVPLVRGTAPEQGRVARPPVPAGLRARRHGPRPVRRRAGRPGDRPRGPAPRPGRPRRGAAPVRDLAATSPTGSAQLDRTRSRAAATRLRRRSTTAARTTATSFSPWAASTAPSASTCCSRRRPATEEMQRRRRRRRARTASGSSSSPARFGSNGRVTFAGRVDDDELAALYARCLAVFYAPVDEDYGFVPYEAFLSEKPVVTTTRCRRSARGRLRPARPASWCEPDAAAPWARRRWLASTGRGARARSRGKAGRRARHLGRDDRPLARRVKVAYFSPLPPERSGIADYSALLLPALRERMDDRRPEAGREATAPRHRRLALPRRQHWPTRTAGSSTPSGAQPGVVVLHDYVLHHLVAGLRWPRDNDALPRRDGDRGRRGRENARPRDHRRARAAAVGERPHEFPLSAPVGRVVHRGHRALAVRRGPSSRGWLDGRHLAGPLRRLLRRRRVVHRRLHAPGPADRLDRAPQHSEANSAAATRLRPVPRTTPRGSARPRRRAGGSFDVSALLERFGLERGSTTSCGSTTSPRMFMGVAARFRRLRDSPAFRPWARRPPSPSARSRSGVPWSSATWAGLPSCPTPPPRRSRSEPDEVDRWPKALDCWRPIEQARERWGTQRQSTRGASTIWLTRRTSTSPRSRRRRAERQSRAQSSGRSHKPHRRSGSRRRPPSRTSGRVPREVRGGG